MRRGRAEGNDRDEVEGESRRRTRWTSDGRGEEAKPPTTPIKFGTNASFTERFQGANSRLSWDTRGRDTQGRWVEGDPTNRFWAKVEVGPGCWLWAAGLDNDGYGRFKQRADGLWVPRKAHVVSWELEHGPVPAGLRLDHLCHSYDDGSCPSGRACWHRRCVRPDHLEPVTTAENNRRRVARTATRGDE